jgi:hypothetical protein
MIINKSMEFSRKKRNTKSLLFSILIDFHIIFFAYVTILITVDGEQRKNVCVVLYRLDAMTAFIGGRSHYTGFELTTWSSGSTAAGAVVRRFPSSHITTCSLTQSMLAVSSPLPINLGAHPCRAHISCIHPKSS